MWLEETEGGEEKVASDEFIDKGLNPMNRKIVEEPKEDMISSASPSGQREFSLTERHSAISFKMLSGFMIGRRPIARWGGAESMSTDGRRELPAVASASASASTASETTAGSAAPARALFLRLIYLNGLPVKARAVHLGYRRFGILILRKSHESKTPGPPRIAVGNDLGFGDFPMRRKRLAQAVVRRVPAQTPNK